MKEIKLYGQPRIIYQVIITGLLINIYFLTHRLIWPDGGDDSIFYSGIIIVMLIAQITAILISRMRKTYIRFYEDAVSFKHPTDKKETCIRHYEIEKVDIKLFEIDIHLKNRDVKILNLNSHKDDELKETKKIFEGIIQNINR